MFKIYRDRNAWLAGDVAATYDGAALALAKREAEKIGATHITKRDYLWHRVNGAWLRG